MAKFDAEQTIAVVSIQQLVHEWVNELDINNGTRIAELLTDDCVYAARGAHRHGRDDVTQFYEERLKDLAATPAGVPVHRHAISNLRVSFNGPDAATIGFNLIYFTTMGMASGADHADPALYADVSMDVRREDDGHWRIARFDSEPVFRRVAG